MSRKLKFVTDGSVELINIAATDFYCEYSREGGARSANSVSLTMRRIWEHPPSPARSWIEGRVQTLLRSEHFGIRGTLILDEGLATQQIIEKVRIVAFAPTRIDSNSLLEYDLTVEITAPGGMAAQQTLFFGEPGGPGNITLYPELLKAVESRPSTTRFQPMFRGNPVRFAGNNSLWKVQIEAWYAVSGAEEAERRFNAEEQCRIWNTKVDLSQRLIWERQGAAAVFGRTIMKAVLLSANPQAADLPDLFGIALEFAHGYPA